MEQDTVNLNCDNDDKTCWELLNNYEFYLKLQSKNMIEKFKNQE